MSDLAARVRGFFADVPHNRALGIVVEELAPGRAVMRLPYAEHLIGNPETGWLHGGAITAVTDACSGAAAFMALPRVEPIATLDLRIDYLKVAQAGRDVIARAHCYRVTRSVAFVRCTAFHQEEPDDPIAAVAATFMLGTRALPEAVDR